MGGWSGVAFGWPSLGGLRASGGPRGAWQGGQLQGRNTAGAERASRKSLPESAQQDTPSPALLSRESGCPHLGGGQGPVKSFQGLEGVWAAPKVTVALVERFEGSL